MVCEWFIKDRTTEQTYPNGTDGSDQSSHSTLKPLHQPISPISPVSGSLPHLRKSPMQTCAFPLGHVVCMQTCAFPHVGIGFAPPSRCFHRMSETVEEHLR